MKCVLALVAVAAVLGAAAAAPTCQVASDRTDCGYTGIDQAQCEARGCCWNAVSPNPDNAPWCFLPGEPVCAPDHPRVPCGPSDISEQQCGQYNCCWSPEEGEVSCFGKVTAPAVYELQSVKETSTGLAGVLVANDTGAISSFGKLISPLAFLVDYVDDAQARVKFFDPAEARWEIPEEFLPLPVPQGKTSSTAYTVATVKSPFSVSITRNSDGVVIFDTSAGLLQFADQFLQAATVADRDPNIYGLGEHRDPLRLPSFHHTYTMWNHDQPTPVDQNEYGSHPFYLEVRSGGAAHGVFLRNSNGMDVTVSSGQVRYRAIGGVLDFFVFAGPTPAAVLKQYQAHVGLPHMPPRWALGWHQCRYGYPSLDWVEQVVRNYSAASIPLEVMWNDIDYMDKYKDFTTDPAKYPTQQMGDFARRLHQQGQRYVVIVDPAIHNEQGYSAYDSGVQSNAFIKTADGSADFVGKVWPGSTVYPDFTQKAVRDGYWPKQIYGFLDQVPVDGLWIDMNEPSNFGNGPGASSSKVNNPPYAINNLNSRAPLDMKTIGMDTRQYPDGPTGANGTEHYNVHNLYGFTEAISTDAALEQYYNERSFVLTRSTFAGSGKYAAKWTGDNYSQFSSMAASVVQIMNLNMFGIPLAGADVCGFLGTTTEELCSRWTALGAFYPFARNHDTYGQPPQEPYLWPSVAAIARKTLAARYSLIPYYYSLFARVAREGGTVATPLFVNFPADGATYGVGSQYMMGEWLLVSPVLRQGATTVSAYFPQARWYDFWGGTELQGVGEKTVTLAAPVDHIPVHVRGGGIIPMRLPGNTTAQQQAHPQRLLVALDENDSAQGELFQDNGADLAWQANGSQTQFSFAAGKLTAQVTQDKYADGAKIDQVTFYGLAEQPSGVTVNSNAVPASQLSYNSTTKVYVVAGLALSPVQAFTLQLQA